jgi:4-hydroxy-2-oxoheptanedioate aldolase
MLGHSLVAESIAALGFDWISIDLQHGAIGEADLVPMLQAVSRFDVTPFVRVASNDPASIGRALDAGVMGVIAPMVNDRAEAEALVAACRYPPRGIRSFGPYRAALYGGADYAACANDEIACVAMIETRRALDNLEEIAATPGLDGLFIGPSDLALALGLAPSIDCEEAEHARTVANIREAARSAGIACGIVASKPDLARRRVRDGFEFVGLISDVIFLVSGAASALKEVRS